VAPVGGAHQCSARRGSSVSGPRLYKFRKRLIANILKKARVAAEFCTHHLFNLTASRDLPGQNCHGVVLWGNSHVDRSWGYRAAAQQLDSAIVDAMRLGAAELSAGVYCRLAEECFSLATVAKNPEVAAELLEVGDDYLRCAAELIGTQAGDPL
jgi:hypothetical protein